MVNFMVDAIIILVCGLVVRTYTRIRYLAMC